MTNSNRSAYLVNAITQCQAQLKRGMGDSGFSIDQGLRTYILASEAEYTHGKTWSVDLAPLERDSPIRRGKTDANKAEYAHLVAANVAAHLNYLRAAAVVVLEDLRLVLLRSGSRPRSSARGLVGEGLPNAYGWIRPPSMARVAESLSRAVQTMAAGTTLDSRCVSRELELLDAEREAYHRENVINNAMTFAWNEAEKEGGWGAGVFVLSETFCDWQRVASRKHDDADANDPLTTPHPGVVDRDPAESSAWRPSEEKTNAFAFGNIWRGRVDRETVLDFLATVVAPHTGLVAAAAVITAHLRQHLKCVSAVVFARAVGFDDGLVTSPDMPEGFREWKVWDRLKVILEWMTLVWRMVLYSHSKMKEVLEERACADRVVAGLLESCPPILFDADWLYEKLLAPWPASTPSLPNPSTIAGLLSAAIVIPGGQEDPVWGGDLTSQEIRWYRLSFNSATFVCTVLLGRARREERAGTKMYVARAASSSDQTPAESTSRAQTRPDEQQFGDIKIFPSSTKDKPSQNPFLANPTYRTKLIWTGDSGGVHRDLHQLLQQCLPALAPIMVPGPDKSSRDWVVLWLVSRPLHLENVVGGLWRQLLRYTTHVETATASKNVTQRLMDKARVETQSMAEAVDHAFVSLE